ncbi:MAG TPA: hypothetical protein VFS43_47030 [Polyangiaceae bacterium]|nr:hypothetical protein [Polyangiaceae bacterium]
MRTTLLRFLPLCALLATGCVIEVEDDDDWSGTAGGGWAGKAGAAGRGGSAGTGSGGVAGSGGSGGTAGAGGQGGPVEEPAYVRFAHLSPNTDAVDVCLRPVDFADSWTHPEFIFGPVFAKNAADVAAEPGDPAQAANPRDFYFPGVSTYFEIKPAGTWEVRLVPAVDDVSTASCETAVEGVPDLSLDLRSGQVLTVALIGDRPEDRGAGAPLALGWAPFAEPDADPERALGHVINALTGGAEATLATFDAATGVATPLANARPTAVGLDSPLELALDQRAKYVFLGPAGADGTRPLLTPEPKVELGAAAGDVWTFFAAGTGAGELAELLRPQTIACKNLVEGRGVSDASLIAADCVYLNSSVPAAPAPAPGELASPGLEVRGTASPRRATRPRAGSARKVRPSVGPDSHGRRLLGKRAKHVAAREPTPSEGWALLFVRAGYSVPRTSSPGYAPCRSLQPEAAPRFLAPPPSPC